MTIKKGGRLMKLLHNIALKVLLFAMCVFICIGYAAVTAHLMITDGAEIGLEGVYSGTEFQYTLSGITLLTEVSPNGGALSFNITITAPKGITAENVHNRTH